MDEFQIVDVPGVGEVEFPASMSDSDILAAVQRLSGSGQAAPGGATGQAPTSAPTGPSLASPGAILGLPAALYGKQAIPGAVRMAGKAIQLGSKAGRIVGGGLGASLGAAATAPAGFPFLGAHVGGLVGSKFARNISKAGKTAGTFVEEMGTRTIPKAGARGTALKFGRRMVGRTARVVPLLGAASMVTDLAQMAEPERQDIGFLGIGRTPNVPGQQPALLNALLARWFGRQ